MRASTGEIRGYPEASIRELEQPLTDAARASEIAANPSPGKWARPSGPPVPPLSAPPFSPLPPLPYSVRVSGINNNVLITGHCARVIVSGIQNQITVDGADAIQASGSENQITYHAGSPTIGNSGIGNLVHKG